MSSEECDKSKFDRTTTGVYQSVRRLVRNVNERERKKRLVVLIDEICDLLPMKCIGKTSRIARLQYLRSYILDLRRKVDGLMFADPNSVYAIEIQQLKKYVEHVEKLNENYCKLLKLAGISATTVVELGDRAWTRPLKYSKQISIEQNNKKMKKNSKKRFNEKSTISDKSKETAKRKITNGDASAVEEANGNSYMDHSSDDDNDVEDDEDDDESNQEEKEEEVQEDINLLKNKNIKSECTYEMILNQNSTAHQSHSSIIQQIFNPRATATIAVPAPQTFILVSAGPNTPAQLVPISTQPTQTVPSSSILLSSPPSSGTALQLNSGPVTASTATAIATTMAQGKLFDSIQRDRKTSKNKNKKSKKIKKEILKLAEVPPTASNDNGNANDHSIVESTAATEPPTATTTTIEESTSAYALDLLDNSQEVDKMPLETASKNNNESKFASSTTKGKNHKKQTIDQSDNGQVKNSKESKLSVEGLRSDQLCLMTTESTNNKDYGNDCVEKEAPHSSPICPILSHDDDATDVGPIIGDDSVSRQQHRSSSSSSTSTVTTNTTAMNQFGFTTQTQPTMTQKSSRCNYSTESLLSTAEQQTAASAPNTNHGEQHESSTTESNSTSLNARDSSNTVDQMEIATNASTYHHHATFTVKDSLMNNSSGATTSVGETATEKHQHNHEPQQQHQQQQQQHNLTSTASSSSTSNGSGSLTERIKRNNVISFDHVADHTGLTFAPNTPVQISTPTLFDTPISSTDCVASTSSAQQFTQLTPALVNLWSTQTQESVPASPSHHPHHGNNQVLSSSSINTTTFSSASATTNSTVTHSASNLHSMRTTNHSHHHGSHHNHPHPQHQSYSSTNPGVFFPNQAFTILSTPTSFDPPNVFASPHHSHHNPHHAAHPPHHRASHQVTVSSSSSTNFNATSFITPISAPQTITDYHAPQSQISISDPSSNNNSSHSNSSLLELYPPSSTTTTTSSSSSSSTTSRSRSSRANASSNNRNNTEILSSTANTFGNSSSGNRTANKQSKSFSKTASSNFSTNNNSGSSNRASKSGSGQAAAVSKQKNASSNSKLSTNSSEAKTAPLTSASSSSTTSNLFSRSSNLQHITPPHLNSHSQSNAQHVTRSATINDNYLHIIPDIINPAFVSGGNSSTTAQADNNTDSGSSSINVNFQSHMPPPSQHQFGPHHATSTHHPHHSHSNSPPPYHHHHHTSQITSSYTNFFGTATASFTPDPSSLYAGGYGESTNHINNNNNSNQEQSSSSPANDVSIIANDYPLFRPQTHSSNIATGGNSYLPSSSSSSLRSSSSNFVNPSPVYPPPVPPVSHAASIASSSSSHVPNFNLSNIFPDITGLNNSGSSSSNNNNKDNSNPNDSGNGAYSEVNSSIVWLTPSSSSSKLRTSAASASTISNISSASSSSSLPSSSVTTATSSFNLSKFSHFSKTLPSTPLEYQGSTAKTAPPSHHNYHHTHHHFAYPPPPPSPSQPYSHLAPSNTSASRENPNNRSSSSSLSVAGSRVISAAPSSTFLTDVIEQSESALNSTSSRTSSVMAPPAPPPPPPPPHHHSHHHPYYHHIPHQTSSNSSEMFSQTGSNQPSSSSHHPHFSSSSSSSSNLNVTSTAAPNIGGGGGARQGSASFHVNHSTTSPSTSASSFLPSNANGFAPIPPSPSTANAVTASAAPPLFQLFNITR